SGGIRYVAIQLLPHLVKAMDRAGSVVVVADARGQLVHARTKVSVVGQAGVEAATAEASGSRQQVLEGVLIHVRLCHFRNCQGLERSRVFVARGRGCAVGQNRRNAWVDLLAGRADLELRPVHSTGLRGQVVVWSRRTIGINDALRQQVRDRV